MDEQVVAQQDQSFLAALSQDLALQKCSAAVWLGPNLFYPAVPMVMRQPWVAQDDHRR